MKPFYPTNAKPNRSFFTLRRLLPLLLILGSFTIVHAGTITSTTTGGTWATPGTWAGGVAPVAGDDVIIADGATVSIAAAAACTNLTVGQGTSGILQYTAAVTLTVSANTTIVAGGTFRASALIGTLSMAGNFTNNGIFDGFVSATIAVNTTFTGAANQLVSGTGGTSDFNLITMSKTTLDATAATNTVELSLSNFTVRGLSTAATGALLTTAAGTGLLKISGTNTFNGNIWSAAIYTIPATLGLWLNNPNFTVNGQNGNATITGRLRVSSGTYNIGTVLGNTTTLSANTSSVIVDGGTLSTTGTVTLTASAAGTPIAAQVSAGAFNIGNLVVAATTVLTCNANTSVNVSGGTLSTIATFGNVTTAASGTLQVSNGTCAIGGTLTNTGFLTISNGTVNVGSTSAHNLVSNGVTATGAFTISGGALNVAGKFTMSSTNAYNQSNGTVTVARVTNTVAAAGTFVTAAGNNFTMTGGSLVLQTPNTFATAPVDYNVLSTTTNLTTGILQIGNASTPASSTFRIQGKTPNLVLDNSSVNNPSITQSAATTILGDLTLNGTGTYASGALALTISGNSITNPGILSVNTATFTMGSAALTLNSTFATQTVSKTTGTVSNIPALTINNGNGVNLNTPVTVSTTLTLTNGIVNTTGLLTLGTTVAGTLVGGSTTSFINGAFARVFPASRTAAGTFTVATLFPIGKNNAFLPVYIDPTTSSAGAVTIKLEIIDDVAGSFAWVNSPLVYTGYKKLSRDWQVTYSGAGAVTACFAGVNTATGTFAVPALEAGTVYAIANNPNADGNYTDGGMLGLYNPSTTLWTTYSAVPANATGLPSATRFSIATAASSVSPVAPGGVNNELKLWLKADSVFGATNTNPLPSWSNSVPGFTAPVQATTIKQPIWLDGTNAAAINYNPIVSFSATNVTFLQFSGLTLTNTNKQYTFFAVANLNSFSNFRSILGCPGVNNNTIWTGGDTYQQGYNNNGPINISASGLLKLGQPGLYNAVFGGVNNASNNIVYNGIGVNNASSATSGANSLSATSQLGSTQGLTGNTWDGTMSEVILYNTAALTPLASQQIQSYLAFKYGITLDQSTGQDYIASGNGSIKMWDHNKASTGFINNIFGIGADVQSALSQKISKPILADGKVLTIATTNDFINSNLDPTRVSPGDLSFEAIADNKGANSWTTAGSKPGFKKLNREWQVQETGAVGTVFVQFDTAIATFSIPGRIHTSLPFYIITDPDGNGNYDDGTAVPLSNTTGSLWSSGIDFTDGSKFTIAIPSVYAGADTFVCSTSTTIYPLAGSSGAGSGTWTEAAGNPSGVSLGATTITGLTGAANADFTTAMPGVYYFIYTAAGLADTVSVTFSNCLAPGGIPSNLWLWVKANAGVTTTGNQVSSWTNQSVIAMTTQASKTPSSHVTYLANGINFNPAINFDGTDLENLFGQFAVTPPVPNSIAVIFAVAVPSAANGGTSGNGCCGNPYSMGPAGGLGITYNNFTYQPDGSGGFGNSTVTTALNEPAIIRVTYPITGTVSGTIMAKNGLAQPASVGGVGVSNFLPAHGFQIGGRTFSGQNDRIFPGKIAEVIHYNASSLSSTQINQIESYLALKYGLMLDNSAGGTAGDMMLSNAATAWSANSNPAFHHQVIGVVRDDHSALVQKQSHTADDSLRIFIGSLAADNGSNGSTISSDLSAIMIGNDGGRLQGDFAASKPTTGIYNRLARTWKVTNTNFNDDFGIEVKWDSVGPFSLTDIRLLVSTSPDFSSATIVDAPDVSFALGSIIVTGIGTDIIPVGSTRFITLASANVTTTLPVELVQFNAKAVDDKQVNLNWKTASETNNAYFTVQKSTDGINNWVDVTTVQGAGTTTLQHNYTAVDNNPYSGKSFYRLKQTDADGKYTYSPIRTVNIRVMALRVYPNPAQGNVMVEGDAAEISRIKVFSVTGQDVTGSVRIISRSGTRTVLDLSRLSNGLYTIKTNTKATKLFKQ